MRFSWLIAGFVSLTLVAAGSCADLPTIKRILAHQKMHGTDPKARTFAGEALKYIDTVRYASNHRDEYVIATKNGVLTATSFYAIEFDGPLRISMSNTGDWYVLGKEKGLWNGTTIDDEKRIAAIVRPSTRGKTVLHRIGQDTNAKSTAPRLVPDGAERIDVVVDRTPPFIEQIEIVTNPNDPVRRRVERPPGVFVGTTQIQIKVTMSEQMAAVPELKITQQGQTPVPAGVVNDENPRFVYGFFPNTAPTANGPATFSLTGTDLAGNPITDASPGFSQQPLLVVDTIAPSLRRVDTSQPGNAQTIPKDGAVIAGSDFPRVIQAFIVDYDQEDDGSFTGPNLSTDHAAGVDWDAVRRNDESLTLRLFAPDGRNIPGMVVARPIALELLLPDVTDLSLGLFQDSDGDGLADPPEGTYRLELSFIDKVGNQRNQVRQWGLDTTPIASKQLTVNLRPVLSSPFANPQNPIPETGTAVKRLDSVEITSPDDDFSYQRSTARLLFHAQGVHFLPVTVKTSLRRTDDSLILDVLRDQDGDGTDDFENPAPGAYLPPGMVDPRWGKNDGLYIIEVEAFDQAGNQSTIKRRLVLDTTAPEIVDTFPKQDITIGGPLRMVDAIIRDPAASSGATGSGILLSESFIRLIFEGNDDVPAQDVPGVAFIHEPNSTDPTVPSYNPDDKYPKLLFEFVDDQGHTTSLPQDGSWDGVYRLELTATDEAGNQVQGTASFTYSAATTSPTTTPLMIRFPTD